MFKDKIRRFIISKRILAKCMFYYFKARGGNRNVLVSNKRKHMDIFNYLSLIEEMPYNPIETVIDNNFYGNGFVLKRYIDSDKDLNAYIEHGLYFGNLVHKDEISWYTKNIITFSANREKHIKVKIPNAKVLKIGPYIHYAQSLVTEDKFYTLKKELGSVLLVFPSHSVKNVTLKYDIDKFVTAIEKIKKDYDTVLVNLFYLDAQNNEIVEKYKTLGYRIVTSGHRFDNYFLDRQKTLISLADMTMSNRIGTHVGYCIYMNKPHYLFKQNSEYSSKNAKEAQRVINARNQEELFQKEKEIEDISQYFYTHNTSITEQQKAIVDKYWGTSCIKTKDELKELLEKL